MDRATFTSLTNRTRRELRAGFTKARIAGDRAELIRLTTLARELDGQMRKAALGALSEAANSVQAIVARIAKRDPAATGSDPVEPGGGEPIDTGSDADGATDLGSDDDDNNDTGTDGPGSDDTDPDSVDQDDEGPDDVTDADTPAPIDPAPMAWGAATRRKHGADFNTRVRGIAARLGCDPSHLMAVMAFETGETFSPKIRNAAGSGATGLIQFMPATARRLGTTTAKLAGMNAIDQLDYVEKYFRTATRRRMRSLSDIYMAVLWPIAVGKAESYVLFRKPSRAYTQNRGLDGNRDGVITKAEASAKVHAKLVKGVKAGRIG